MLHVAAPLPRYHRGSSHWECDPSIYESRSWADVWSFHRPHKKAIGLPLAAVILIDGQQVGATALPSNRLCLFTQAAVCPLCPPPGPRSPNLQSWREERDGNDATPPRGAESEKKKKFYPKLFFFFSSSCRNHPSSRAAGCRASSSTAPTWHLLYSVSALLTYQSIIRCSIPRGAHKLDPIMRRSNDCLCIFGLDFQLYAADIIVLDAEVLNWNSRFPPTKKNKKPNGIWDLVRIHSWHCCVYH